MAVPTITSLTPSIGLASGDQLITIAGTGFHVAVDEAPGVVNPADGMNPENDAPSIRTVMVTFDGVASPLVKVYSSTLLTAILPPGNAGNDTQAPPGRSVTVQVINVTQGTTTPIGGESVSAVNAFTYARPMHTTEYESALTYTVRIFLQLLKGQLLVDEVNYAVQTDYDPTTDDELHVTKFAKLPGIILVGPDLRENRFYSLNEQPTYPDGTTSKLDGVSPAGFLETRVPYTVDMVFQIIGVSDTKTELLNLMANFVMMMHKNKFLVVQRDAQDATKGTVRYELDFEPGGQPKNATMPNNSNLRSWEASVVIRGFDIEAFSGLTTDGTSDPANLIPAHAVIDHGRCADNVTLAPGVPLGILSQEDEP